MEVAISDDRRNWSELWSVEHGTPLPSPRNLAKDFCEDYPPLTMRGLKAAKLLIPGHTRARTLVWPSLPTYTIECHLEDPAQPFIVARTDLADGDDQLVALVANNSGRLFMVCPLTRRHCSTLYLRDGLFASRQANNLINRSQRSGVARQ